MSSIEWETALGYAEDSAISSRKPILFYYFDPDCIGCQQMDAVTYSSEEVVKFVREYLIPLRIEQDKKASYDRYNVIWTPTLLILDYQGHEVQRSIGFLEPEDFIAHMQLGIAKVRFAVGEYDTAGVHFKRLFDRYPDNSTVPEAMYFSGVNRYKQNNDPTELKTVYEKMLSEYPDNSWTKKASPYRLL
ncbi:MAG: thioredoxin fold domain-containing protein [Desulforhopalus sp.]